jgi:hypothetical protein
MHIAGKFILEIAAQEWHVLTAYLGTLILLEIRRYVYLLGCMFEEVPEPAGARSSRRQ